MAKLTSFKALSFDCYGTIIDWEAGILSDLQPLLQQVKLNRPSSNTIFQTHARHELVQTQQTPAALYRDILAIVYKRLAEDWGVSASWSECQQYGASVKTWPAFTDSAKALAYLKRHYKLIVLSNIDNENFESSRQSLGDPFDVICTAQDIGSYKPSKRNFNYLLRRVKDLGIERDQLLHVAESMFHDVIPSQRAGLATCRINRRHDREGFGASADPGNITVRPDFVFNSMIELVEAHQAASR